MSRNIVTIVYDSDSLSTEITVDGRPFDTARIKGREIIDWLDPFIIRKIKWDGFYDEMVTFLDGNNQFDVVFIGDKDALGDLKKALQGLPVTVLDKKESIVNITYDEDTVSTSITIDGSLFDTSRITGKEIADWVYPFMIRKVVWNGIFNELKNVIGSNSFTIVFNGSVTAFHELQQACEIPVKLIFDDPSNTADVVNKTDPRDPLAPGILPAKTNSCLDDEYQEKYEKQYAKIESVLNRVLNKSDSEICKRTLKICSPIIDLALEYANKGCTAAMRSICKNLMHIQDNSSPEEQDLICRRLSIPNIANKLYTLTSDLVSMKDAPSYDMLGDLYLSGIGCEIDLHKSFELYNAGAKLGDPAAIFDLSQVYFYGFKDVCSRNVPKAVAILSDLVKNAPDNEAYQKSLMLYKTAIDLSECYDVNNPEYYKPFGDDEEKNFLYSLFFNLSSDTLGGIYNFLQKVDQAAQKEPADAACDLLDYWEEYIDLIFGDNDTFDFSEEQEKDRSSFSVELVNWYYDTYDTDGLIPSFIDYVVQLLKSLVAQYTDPIYTSFDADKSDIINSIIEDTDNDETVNDNSDDNWKKVNTAYCSNLATRLSILSKDLSADFSKNKFKIISAFDEYSGINTVSNSPFAHSIIDEYNSISNRLAKLSDEINSTDTKSAIGSLAGGAAGGLLAAIPIIGIPLAIGAGIGAGVLSENYAEKKRAELLNQLPAIVDDLTNMYCIGTVVLLLDNSSRVLLDTIREKTEQLLSNSFPTVPEDDYFDSI